MKRRRFLAVAASTALPVTVSAAESRKLRVVVIGHTGRGNYGHGIDTMWLKVPATEIVAVADADPAGLKAELKKLKVDKGFADYRKMLGDVKPDIVAIGPRHIDQHRDMALAAVEAGARGIYMEKPFCRSLAEADEIVAACDKRGAKLAVAHRNRWHPVMAVVQRLVKEGAIGRVLEFRARGKEDPRGGSLDLWVLGSHLTNIICAIAGNPVAGSAVVLQNGKPVTKADVKEGDEGIGPLAGNEIHARFEMEGGIPAFFDSVQNAGERQAGFGVQIVGTKGIIDWRVDKEPPAHLLAGSPFDPVKEPRVWKPISTAGIDLPEPLPGIGQRVTDHTVGAEDARTTIEMISAVFESHRLGGKRVTFPLETRGNPLAML